MPTRKRSHRNAGRAPTDHSLVRRESKSNRRGSGLASGRSPHVRQLKELLLLRIGDL